MTAQSLPVSMTGIPVSGFEEGFQEEDYYMGGDMPGLCGLISIVSRPFSISSLVSTWLAVRSIKVSHAVMMKDRPLEQRIKALAIPILESAAVMIAANLSLLSMAWLQTQAGVSSNPGIAGVTDGIIHPWIAVGAGVLLFAIKKRCPQF